MASVSGEKRDKSFPIAFSCKNCHVVIRPKPFAKRDPNSLRPFIAICERLAVQGFLIWLKYFVRFNETVFGGKDKP
jgi:hypothetical protein